MCSVFGYKTKITKRLRTKRQEDAIASLFSCVYFSEILGVCVASLKQVISAKLMRRAKAYSSSCSQVIVVYLHPFRRNSLFCSQKSPKNRLKSIFLGFKVV